MGYLRSRTIQGVHLTLVGVVCACHGAVAAEPIAAGPTRLDELLTIAWQRGANLPQGFQDSKGGVVDHTLISVGGFCSGNRDVPGKPDTYPRGFLNKVWGLPLDRRADRWSELPPFPGVERQGLDAAVVGDSLYCFGGFNYTAPYCYRDCYRLTKSPAGWGWDLLPNLPWALAGHGSAVVDGKIFIVGGADYDAQRFHTVADRTAKVDRLGARLIMLDPSDVKRGWQELPACPGTPRFVHAVATVGGKVHVIGGAATARDSGATHTVVDNWRFDPVSQSWQALPDLPVASGNFPAGAIVYADRYILLVGGYQYGAVMRPDGSTAPTYGTPTRHYADNAMCSDVFVFDTREKRFGRATPMPLNNNLPLAVIDGDHLHLIGGEIGAAVIDGEHYGHHPDLHLVGTIRVNDR
jgi:hypothetical protein